MPQNALIFCVGGEQLKCLLKDDFSFIASILFGMNGRYLTKDRGVRRGLPDDIKGVAEGVFQ